MSSMPQTLNTSTHAAIFWIVSWFFWTLPHASSQFDTRRPNGVDKTQELDCTANDRLLGLRVRHNGSSPFSGCFACRRRTRA